MTAVHRSLEDPTCTVAGATRAPGRRARNQETTTRSFSHNPGTLPTRACGSSALPGRVARSLASGTACIRFSVKAEPDRMMHPHGNGAHGGRTHMGLSGLESQKLLRPSSRGLLQAGGLTIRTARVAQRPVHGVRLLAIRSSPSPTVGVSWAWRRTARERAFQAFREATSISDASRRRRRARSAGAARSLCAPKQRTPTCASMIDRAGRASPWRP